MVAQLRRRYERDWQRWLRGEDAWPLIVKIGNLKEEDWDDAGRDVASWIKNWQASNRGITVEWTTRRFKHRGELPLPDRIVFKGPGELAAWVGMGEHWDRASLFRDLSFKEWPEAAQEIDRYLDSLIQYNEIDITLLRSTIAWLADHPASGMYKRALPVRGIDSKWLESRLPMVADFVTAISGSERSSDALSDIGLRGPPRLIRWRLLSDRLRKAIGGIDSLATSIEDLAGLSLRPGKIIVIENLETMLALPDIEDTMAILGAGYAVDALGRVPWLPDRRLAYWGDLDTHGFAILSHARSYVPGIASILMDRATLFEHADLWSFERDQHRAVRLDGLTPDESSLFTELRENRLGIGVRLEQERIPLKWAFDRLMQWGAE